MCSHKNKLLHLYITSQLSIRRFCCFLVCHYQYQYQKWFVTPTWVAVSPRAHVPPVSCVQGFTDLMRRVFVEQRYTLSF